MTPLYCQRKLEYLVLCVRVCVFHPIGLVSVFLQITASRNKLLVTSFNCTFYQIKLSQSRFFCGEEKKLINEHVYSSLDSNVIQRGFEAGDTNKRGFARALLKVASRVAELTRRSVWVAERNLLKQAFLNCSFLLSRQKHSGKYQRNTYASL